MDNKDKTQENEINGSSGLSVQWWNCSSTII